MSHFPLAMLAVVVLRYTGTLSPHVVIPVIFRAGWLYWLGVLMLAALYLAGPMIEDALEVWFIISPLVMAVVGTYTMMSNARILGVVYRERQKELDWRRRAFSSPRKPRLQPRLSEVPDSG